MDVWLIRTVMALYTEACTVVRTDAGLSEGSLLHPLLFAAVVDVVSSEVSGLPLELLYADDLVLMAPTMEQHDRHLTGWRASLLDKGLKVNAGKSNVMVGSSGGKMIVYSGKWCLWERSAGKLCSVHSMYFFNDSQAVQWCAWGVVVRS